jgi:hypothetical protein
MITKRVEMSREFTAARCGTAGLPPFFAEAFRFFAGKPSSRLVLCASRSGSPVLFFLSGKEIMRPKGGSGKRKGLTKLKLKFRISPCTFHVF